MRMRDTKLTTCSGAPRPPPWSLARVVAQHAQQRRHSARAARGVVQIRARPMRDGVGRQLARLAFVSSAPGWPATGRCPAWPDAAPAARRPWIASSATAVNRTALLGVASRMRLSIICRNSASNCLATCFVRCRRIADRLTSRFRSDRRPRSKTDSVAPPVPPAIGIGHDVVMPLTRGRAIRPCRSAGPPEGKRAALRGGLFH